MIECVETRREMRFETFDELRGVVYALSGISLGERKQALLAARLSKRMRVLGIAHYEAYLELLQTDESGEELRQLLDAISTNVTSFYRESGHFDFIAERMAEWLAEGQRRFRFWSAACSTGEEPLTLAMTVLDACEGYDVDVRILATDISGRVIERCREAVYPAEKLSPVPPLVRQKWFSPVDGEPGSFRAHKRLRDVIAYQRLNLSVPPFPMTGPFDGILCRNVMIYFDNPVRQRLLQELFRLTKPGGHLYVGHAESLTGILSDFRSVRPSVYRRP